MVVLAVKLLRTKLKMVKGLVTAEATTALKLEGQGGELFPEQKAYSHLTRVWNHVYCPVVAGATRK